MTRTPLLRTALLRTPHLAGAPSSATGGDGGKVLRRGVAYLLVEVGDERGDEEALLLALLAGATR